MRPNYNTKATTATLALDNGANVLGAQKRMRSGASYLNYTAILASKAPPPSISVNVPLGGGITLNGSVSTAQDVPVGSYVDTLQVLVSS
jgi:spore coat protein U-like protein